MPRPRFTPRRISDKDLLEAGFILTRHCGRCGFESEVHPDAQSGECGVKFAPDGRIEKFLCVECMAEITGRTIPSGKITD